MSGSDYSTAVVRDLSFGDASRQQCFSITIIDDTIREILPTETLKVDLTVDPAQSAASQVTLVTPSVTVTIIDDDGMCCLCSTLN